MANWTAVKTWSAGEVPTAALVNAHLRDNTAYLLQRTLAGGAADVVLSGAPTTTSATFVDVTGATVAVTTVAANMDILIIAFGHLSNSGAADVTLTATVDGTNVGNATYGLQIVQIAGAGGNYPFCVAFRYTVAAAGAHTVNLQWKTSAGTATIHGDSAGQFSAGEIG